MKQLWMGGALLVSSCIAQTTTGSIYGTVRDTTGGAVAAAEIVVIENDSALRRAAQSGVDGRFRFDGLPPGAYSVQAGAPQLETQTVELLRVAVDARLRQDFTLKPSPVREVVAVSAPLHRIDEETTALGMVLDRDRIEKLPLNRRDFLQLGLLLPGVLPPVQDSELSSRGSFATHVSGAREEYNNFTLDGADNNDPYTNRYVLQPSVESIREFKVLSSSYSAEYGRSAGGQVNVVTRSGSNAWHGALYEYLRNRALDARNFFDLEERNKYARSQFGGSLGGALRKDRVFGFVNYEGLRERRGITRLGTVPTVEQRAGDLSALARPPVDPFSGLPFAAGRIPAARIARLAPRVLELFPLPNLPGAGGNFLGQPVLRDTYDTVLARADHHLSARDILTVRYGWGSQKLFEPFAEESTGVPGFGNDVRNTGHSITLQHQRLWSAPTVHTSRFTYVRSFRQALQQNHPTDVGALWGVDWLGVRARDFGFPVINVAGYSPVGDAAQLPIDRTTGTWQLQQGLALWRGAHSLKVGGEIRRYAVDGFLDYFARGSLSFSGALTTSGIADLLLGWPSFGIQSNFDNRQSQRTTAVNLYAQDDWRLSRDFTLSLGLRYEFFTPASDPEDRMYILDPGAGRLVQVGRDGFPRGGYASDRNNFAPRAGFAWTPSDKWVIRGGHGWFYDSGMFVVNSSLYFNPPLFNVRIFFPTQTSLLTLENPFPTNGGLTPPPSPNTLSPDITTSYLHHWNLGVERQVDSSTTFTLAYGGSKGTHLVRSRDINQPLPAPGEVAFRRPNPAFAGIFFIETGGNSHFQSLQARLDRRLARGISLLASYTWSKSIDDTSAFLGTRPDKNFPQDSRNYRAERALSSYDMRHRFTTAAQVATPWRHALLRDFEWRAIVVAQTGQPFTPMLRFDNSNTGNGASGIFGADRPDLTGDPRLSERTPERWFDTASFRIPLRYTFGSAGRNIVAGPGLVNFDIALSRRFALTDRAGFTFDVQTFNLFNTAHFELPERFADEPSTFGRIFSAKAPRQIQFALRLSF